MNLISIFLMGAPTEGAEPNPMGTFLPLILIVVVFYLFFIRPQTKKNKELRKFRENIKKGDKIVTIGGVHGKILEVKEKTIIIETEGQGRLKIEKSAISTSGASEEQIAQNK
jgi:preprotein translocase subunit YajC